MKKWLALLLGVFICLVAVAPVLAFDGHPQNFKGHKEFKQKTCGLEQVIKDSLAKNKGDLSKVKQDVDKWAAEMAKLKEERLNKIAAQKGVSSAELKKQWQQKRAGKLDKLAAKHGMTAEQFKQARKSQQQAKLQAMATRLGLSVEQLKQVLPAVKDIHK